MNQQRPTKTIRVRRQYLVQRTQEWHLSIPADYDTDEWMANDLAGFDQQVRDQGRLVVETHVPLEDNQLETTVMTEGENL